MSPPVQVLLCFAPLVGLVVIYPTIIRVLMRLRPISDAAFREQLDALADHHRLQISDFVVWSTGGRYQNAAVVGALPWNRFVVLSDGLLQRLDSAERMALVRHELAHARRWHVLLRVLLVALPLWSWLWIRPIVPVTWYEHWEHLCRLSGIGLSPEIVRFLAVPTLLACVLRLSLGKLSRFLEHDADLSGCECYASHVSLAERRDACQALQRALKAIVPRAQHDQATWLHPSVNQRIAVLEVSLRDDQYATQMRDRSQLLLWLLPAAFVGIPLIAMVLAG